MNRTKILTLLLVLVISLLLYGISAGTQINDQTRTPQYVYLAYSFLHGRLDLVERPPSAFDLISYENRWYVPGGAASALLLIPFVAFFGLEVSDIFFGVVIGALNVTLMFSMLDQLNENKPGVRNWLTLLFAAGTVHWWVSSVGSVWFNAHLVALLFMILYARETLGNNNPWVAGIWLGFATLSRPTTLFSILFYILYVPSQNGRQALLRKILPFCATVAGFIALMMAYNYLRFSHPLEFGYGHVRGTQALTDTYTVGGGFNIRYIPCNFYVSILGLPNLPWNPLPTANEVCSYLEPIRKDFGEVSSFFNPIGMSLFLTTPAFALIFRNKWKDKLVASSWAGIIAVLIPLWMYHTTGWTQFGYRYSLDFMVFIFILLSLAVTRVGWLEWVLTVPSIVMGFIGLNLMYFLTIELKWTDVLARGVEIIVSRIFGVP